MEIRRGCGVASFKIALCRREFIVSSMVMEESEWSIHDHQLCVRRGLNPDRVMQIAGAFASWVWMQQAFPSHVGEFLPSCIIRVGENDWPLFFGRGFQRQGWQVAGGRIIVQRIRDTAILTARTMEAVDWAWRLWMKVERWGMEKLSEDECQEFAADFDEAARKIMGE